jgi:hypothetical protein
MPYAMIPDGYSIKKVTKLQKQAVNAKRRHDNVTTFLGNETTPLLMGGVTLLAVLPILAGLFYKSLEAEGILLTDEQKMKIEVGFRGLLLASPATGPIVLTKKIWDTVFGEKDEETSNGDDGIYGLAGLGT